MFARPPSPAGAIVMGICGFLSGVVGLLLLNTDWVFDRGLGVPIGILIVALWVFGIYLIALGIIWRARDRRGA